MKKFVLISSCISTVLALSGCAGKADSSSSSVGENEIAETTAGITSAEVTETEPVTEKETVTEPETTTEPETQPPTEPPSDGKLVRILDYIPDAVIDLRYATDNNFTGTVIYDSPEAYLCYGSVKKLAKVQEELKEKGFCLVIWDAYRPVEAQERLWEVYPDPIYVADPRNGITSHSKGNTVDIGIVHTDGSEVELPSGFDEFSSIADRDYSDVSETAALNSIMLEEIMTANGFSGYWGEWWHYGDIDEYTIEE